MMITIEKEKQLAKEKGWQYLGREDVPVSVPLTDSEKISLGKSQAESLGQIQELGVSFSEFKKQYKNKFDAHQIILAQTSECLRTGMKESNKSVSTFIDPRTRLKIYFDFDTGEVVKSCEPDDRDIQMRIEE